MRSRIASSQASELAASWAAGFGGVCGKKRLKAASSSDAMPAVKNAQALPSFSAVPSRLVPRAFPSQSMKPPASDIEGILAQSARMKMNGQLAAIQPIVPHRRTFPKSSLASFSEAKAIAFVTEIVGT